MFNVVLYEPEIPPNTGNVIRLCANTGSALHLIQPLGFRLDDRELKRAGLDYHEYTRVHVHESWSACQIALSARRAFAFSTRGARRFTDAVFAPGDILLFGSETRGLPAALLAGFAPDRQLRLPMLPVNRSINLSNAVAIAVYEAWRQNGFAGGS